MKIAVSLPADQVAAARRAVAEGRAASVSAYIADAMAHVAREDALAELLDDFDRELGEPDDATQAWADGELRRAGLVR